MKRLVLLPVLVAALFLPCTVGAQEVAPLFEQVPAVMYETYKGTTADFDDYFSMLVERYAGTDGYGWSIYRENPKVSYRVTVLPDGLQTMMAVQQARQASFQDFTEEQVALWNRAWETRHVAVYTAAPALSVVPEGFTVDDIRALPFHRTTVYHLDWDKAAAFRQALRERAELERAANHPGFVLTVWNGGIGTEAQTVMVRVSAESRMADIEAARARNAAREPYRDEFRRLSAIMWDATLSVERHDQMRWDNLSFVPGN